MDNAPELTSEQYEAILKYIQTTNEQNFQAAVQTMKNFHFNLQNAINSKFGMGDIGNQHANEYVDEEQYNGMNNNQGRRNGANRNDQQVQRYINYLREKQNRSIFVGIFNFTKNFMVGLVKGLSQILLPEFLLKRIMRSTFYTQYKPLILPEFKDRNLSYHLKNSYLSRKPIMFIISSPGITHGCLVKLFNRPAIVKKINQSFIFAGTISTDKQCEKIQGEKQPPCIIVCRQNIFEKLEIVKRFIGETAIQTIDVDRLNYALRDHQKATRRDKNLLVKYRNYIRRHYYNGRPGFYEQEEQQQELYHEKHTVVSDMIKRQNQDYKKVQEESKRKASLQLMEQQKQKQELKKQQQLMQQRKVRKMSIPDEPTDGDIIRISFRCPDGNTKVRNFDSTEKLDLIYHWVETNEEIQFEDNIARNFELMHGYPPTSLANRKDDKLKDIFDSDLEKIMIKEL